MLESNRADGSLAVPASSLLGAGMSKAASSSQSILVITCLLLGEQISEHPSYFTQVLVGDRILISSDWCPANEGPI